ncbi:alpha/beta hydrolase [Roseovarius spongiae]|uniref:Alpha/beta hydrolase n=1 Tax=Roseovarius spongiae TaxID=2320272 RepID=A0A3A8AYS6_9RHOB|nr:alpha/beta hydrolase [Roseovarius spongiae]RKF17177.1 alpha/beta hydrolase [Roseovarius spongiae]
MGKFQSADGLGLHYEDGGDGPPVLCLSGLTRNSSDFRYLAPFLPEYRLIRPDYRGRGLSDHAPDAQSYTIAQEAADAIALLDHLGLDKVTVLGTSRGGLIAMLLAHTHPERLNGIILNDIGPEVTQTGIARIMDYVGRPPTFADYAEAATALKEMNEPAFPGVTHNRWRVQAEMMWCAKPGGGLGLRYDPRLRDALEGQAGAGPAPDLWALFDAAARLPLTALRGANSDLLSDETFAKMRDRAPEMRAVIVPDRGHVPFLDEAEALKAIRAHLEDHGK